jgi:hypothetical protein
LPARDRGFRAASLLLAALVVGVTAIVCSIKGFIDGVAVGAVLALMFVIVNERTFFLANSRFISALSKSIRTGAGRVRALATARFATTAARQSLSQTSAFSYDGERHGSLWALGRAFQIIFFQPQILLVPVEAFLVEAAWWIVPIALYENSPGMLFFLWIFVVFPYTIAGTWGCLIDSTESHVQPRKFWSYGFSYFGRTYRWCLSIGRKAVASEIRESCAVELSSCY